MSVSSIRNTRRRDRSPGRVAQFRNIEVRNLEQRRVVEKSANLEYVRCGKLKLLGENATQLRIGTDPEVDAHYRLESTLAYGDR